MTKRTLSPTQTPEAEEYVSGWQGIPVSSTLSLAILGVMVCVMGAFGSTMDLGSGPPSAEASYQATLWWCGIPVVLGIAGLLVGQRNRSRVWILGAVLISIGVVLMVVTTTQFNRSQEAGFESTEWLDDLPFSSNLDRDRLDRETAWYDGGLVGVVGVRLGTDEGGAPSLGAIDPILRAAGAQPIRGGCANQVAYYRLEDKRTVLLMRGSNTTSIRVLYDISASPESGGNREVLDGDLLCSE